MLLRIDRLARLVPEGRSRIRKSFSDIPARERYLTIENGRPGLRRLHVNVNGIWVERLRLRRGQVQMLDLAQHMLPEENIVTLVGEGRPGSSALILISDVPGTGDASGANPLRIECQPGTWRPGVSMHWGR